MGDILSKFQEAKTVVAEKRQAEATTKAEFETAKASVLQPVLDVWEALAYVRLDLKDNPSVGQAFYMSDDRPGALLLVASDQPAFVDFSRVTPEGAIDLRINVLLDAGAPHSDPPEHAAEWFIGWIAAHEMVDAKAEPGAVDAVKP